MCLDGSSRAYHQHTVLGSEWVFKGGTCLKKCYFETYRFSEDLDFTIKSPDHLEEGFLKTAFQEIAGWIYDRTGIQIPPETVRFEVYNNPRGIPSVQGRIGYRGPMMRGGDFPRIKLISQTMRCLFSIRCAGKCIILIQTCLKTAFMYKPTRLKKFLRKR